MKSIQEILKERRQELEDIRTYILLNKIYYGIIGFFIGLIVAILIFFA